MDLADRLLAGNLRYRETEFTDRLARCPAPPRLRLAVVACMDARHVPERVLGLSPGDAKVIRVAGAVVDEGVLRSLVAAVHLLGVRHVALMGHTDCGLMGVAGRMEALAQSVATATGKPMDEAAAGQLVTWLQAYEEVRAHIVTGLERIGQHPLLARIVSRTGLLYDNATGAVELVGRGADAPEQTPARQ